MAEAKRRADDLKHELRRIQENAERKLELQNQRTVLAMQEIQKRAGHDEEQMQWQARDAERLQTELAQARADAKAARAELLPLTGENWRFRQEVWALRAELAGVQRGRGPTGLQTACAS